MGMEGPRLPQEASKPEKQPDRQEAARRSISLDRNAPLSADIEFKAGHFYRMIGENGFRDFMETGVIRPAPDTKQEYERSYYFKGFPRKRYQRGDTDYFVEVKPRPDLFAEGDAHYPYSNRDISREDEIRIYEYRRKDGTATLVFDSFKGDSFAS